ncbi:hypothetical protein N9R79_02950 [Vibrio sp.]|nr:hypothetical protein [Vibrio sp.]
MMYKKLIYTHAAQVVPRLNLENDISELFTEDTLLADAISILKEKKMKIELVALIAHALPVREGIWWGYKTLALRQADWKGIQTTALDTIEQWVKQPSEESRRKAEYLANKLELSCGPSWLAQAVFWNGSGSIIAPDQPTVLPEADLYCKAIAGAIAHSAALPEWDNSEEYYNKSIHIALDIASGGSGQI